MVSFEKKPCRNIIIMRHEAVGISKREKGLCVWTPEPWTELLGGEWIVDASMRGTESESFCSIWPLPSGAGSMGRRCLVISLRAQVEGLWRYPVPAFIYLIWETYGCTSLQFMYRAYIWKRITNGISKPKGFGPRDPQVRCVLLPAWNRAD